MNLPHFSTSKISFVLIYTYDDGHATHFMRFNVSHNCEIFIGVQNIIHFDSLDWIERFCEMKFCQI